MKIFIDTAPFIYFIEGNPKYLSRIARFFSDSYTNGSEMLTSVITYSEFGVKPCSEGKLELVGKFDRFLEKSGVEMLAVKKTHAQKAYELRARYKFLKGMDAIQLGVAIEEDCDKVLTNDLKWKKNNEINCFFIDEL